RGDSQRRLPSLRKRPFGRRKKCQRGGGRQGGAAEKRGQAARGFQTQFLVRKRQRDSSESRGRRNLPLLGRDRQNPEGSGPRPLRKRLRAEAEAHGEGPRRLPPGKTPARGAGPKARFPQGGRGC